VLAYSAVDRGFESRLGKIKDYEIGMCCFSAKIKRVNMNEKFEDTREVTRSGKAYIALYMHIYSPLT
jgi:hypothetical protein